MVWAVVTAVWTAATVVRTMVTAAKRRDEVVRSPAIVEHTVGLIVIDSDTRAAIV
ncbi:hypothetical protein SAMN04515617_11672 [Collimonas sp. OK242]|nr:hypothetical protein SAMN04515617_11672 [Collimonas sp. OK242]